MKRAWKLPIPPRLESPLAVIKSLLIDLSHLRQRTGDAGLDFGEIAQAKVAAVAAGRGVGISPERDNI